MDLQSAMIWLVDLMVRYQEGQSCVQPKMSQSNNTLHGSVECDSLAGEFNDETPGRSELRSSRNLPEQNTLHGSAERDGLAGEFNGETPGRPETCYLHARQAGAGKTMSEHLQRVSPQPCIFLGSHCDFQK
jgi:hypothetical protein